MMRNEANISGSSSRLGLVNLRAHRQAPRVGVERRCDVAQPGAEHLPGKGQHRDLDRRAELQRRRVRSAHIGDQPDEDEVADREHRIGGAGIDVLAEADLALDDRAGDRRADE